MSALEPVDTIRQRLNRAAAKACGPDHNLTIDVQVIDRHPLGRRNELVNELYPAGGGRLTTRPTTLAGLTADIERTAWGSMKHRRRADRQVTRQLSTKIGSVLDMPRAEHFVVVGPEEAHPFEAVYWNRWYLSVDRIAGRCIALAVGASD